MQQKPLPGTKICLLRDSDLPFGYVAMRSSVSLCFLVCFWSLCASPTVHGLKEEGDRRVPSKEDLLLAALRQRGGGHYGFRIGRPCETCERGALASRSYRGARVFALRIYDTSTRMMPRFRQEGGQTTSPTQRRCFPTRTNGLLLARPRALLGCSHRILLSCSRLLLSPQPKPIPTSPSPHALCRRKRDSRQGIPQLQSGSGPRGPYPRGPGRDPGAEIAADTPPRPPAFGRGGSDGSPLAGGNSRGGVWCVFNPLFISPPLRRQRSSTGMSTSTAPSRSFSTPSRVPRRTHKAVSLSAKSPGQGHLLLTRIPLIARRLSGVLR